MTISLVLFGFTGYDQLGYQFGPFVSKNAGSCQAAITADDHEAIDIVRQQIAGGAAPPVTLHELRTTRRPNDGASLMEDAADVIPIRPYDVLAALYQAPVAFVHEEDFEISRNPGSHDGSNRGIHAGSVTPARQNGEALHTVCH